MSEVNIFFYSQYCEPSQLLINMMKNEGLDKYFHFISTDNNPKLDPRIRITPSLIIRGIPSPYVANEAFMWLSKMKQWKMNMILKKMGDEQQKYMKSIDNNLTDNNSNVISFSPMEMEGMSDFFAYIKRDEGVPHNHFSYNNIGKESIFTPPLEDGTYKIRKNKKGDPNQLNNNYKKLEKERKEQDKINKEATENFIKNYKG